MSACPVPRFALLIALLILGLAACESSGQAGGVATENGGRGKVKVGLPF
jgi:hypothetical protein